MQLRVLRPMNEQVRAAGHGYQVGVGGEGLERLGQGAGEENAHPASRSSSASSMPSMIPS